MGIRAMNFHVTSRAVSEPRSRQVMEVRRIGRAYPVRIGMTFDAKLKHLRALKHSRIGRPMRVVAQYTAFYL